MLTMPTSFLLWTGTVSCDFRIVVVAFCPHPRTRNRLFRQGEFLAASVMAPRTGIITPFLGVDRFKMKLMMVLMVSDVVFKRKKSS
jgi:hypothetical protein